MGGVVRMKNLKAIAAALLGAAGLSVSALAQDVQGDLMARGMWKDPATGLTWSRCMIGQKWNGVSCDGAIVFRTWAQTIIDIQGLRLGGHSDWRTPTAAELLGLRRCELTSAEGVARIPTPEGPKEVPRKCASKAPFNTQDGSSDNEPFFDPEVFKFWPVPDTRAINGNLYSIVTASFASKASSSYYGYRPETNEYDYWWQLKRSGAFWEHQAGEVAYFAGLAVRGAAVPAEYAVALSAARATIARAQEAQRLQAAKAQEAAVQRSADDKARVAREAAFMSAMNQRDPQAMYLAAGRYERNGDSEKARQVYERLIDRFASSPWAVKASDQLSQNQRVDSVNSQSRRATEEIIGRAYNQCRIEVDSCLNRGGKGCYRDCDKLR